MVMTSCRTRYNPDSSHCGGPDADLQTRFVHQHCHTRSGIAKATDGRRVTLQDFFTKRLCGPICQRLQDCNRCYLLIVDDVWEDDKDAFSSGRLNLLMLASRNSSCIMTSRHGFAAQSGAWPGVTAVQLKPVDKDVGQAMLVSYAFDDSKKVLADVPDDVQARFLSL
jgi:hypothetical protein